MSDCLLFDYSQMTSAQVEEIFQVTIPDIKDKLDDLYGMVNGFDQDVPLILSKCTAISGLLNDVSNPVRYWWQSLLIKPVWYLSVLVLYMFAYLFKFLLRIFPTASKDFTTGWAVTIVLRLYNPGYFSNTSAVYSLEFTESDITEEPELLFSFDDDSYNAEVKHTSVFSFPSINLNKIFSFTEGENTYYLIEELFKVLKVSDNS